MLGGLGGGGGLLKTPIMGYGASLFYAPFVPHPSNPHPTPPHPPPHIYIHAYTFIVVSRKIFKEVPFKISDPLLLISRIRLMSLIHKRVCTCVTKHSNAFRTFLNWLKNSKRVWHERKLHILRLPIFANFDL